MMKKDCNIAAGERRSAEKMEEREYPLIWMGDEEKEGRGTSFLFLGSLIIEGEGSSSPPIPIFRYIPIWGIERGRQALVIIFVDFIILLKPNIVLDSVTQIKSYNYSFVIEDAWYVERFTWVSIGSMWRVINANHT